MLHDSPIFSGFSVNDMDAASQFYGKTLGLEVTNHAMGLTITTISGHNIFVYQKDDHVPATYTIMNFEVTDIEDIVSQLNAKGVTLEQYPDMTDKNGIAWGSKTGQGPDIAWFKDPAGNFLAILNSPSDQQAPSA